jgi:inositol hexakisphosphate/diphosphoinositol-pentakisphosphate kinase
LRKVWRDLDEAKTTGKSLACFYFTYVHPQYQR